MATLAQVDLFQEGALIGLPMPLTLRPPVPLTDEQILSISRLNRPYRIELNEDGELEIMSPLGFEGGQRELFVARMLGNWAEVNGGVCVSSNAGFRLPAGAVRGPDASWTSEASLSRLSDKERRGFAPLCPAFLVEIHSESDSRRVLEAKMPMWIDKGAQLAWMIDPFAATVSIYKPGRAPEVLERPEWVEAGEPVAGFRLETAKLWDV
jgi:Uma2 family endonuclease